MSELTDDQLDGLFRKSAEEFEPPYDPAAWQDMKPRLDTHDRIAPGGAPSWKNLLRWGIIGVVLLLLLGGVWFSYQNAIQSSIGSKLLPIGNEPQPETSTTTLPQRTNASALGDIVSAQKAAVNSPDDQSAKGNQPVVSAETYVEPDASNRRPDLAIARVTGTKMPDADKTANASLPRVRVAGAVKAKRNPSVRSAIVTPTIAKRDNRTALDRAYRKNSSRPSTQKQVKTGRSGRGVAYSATRFGVPADLSFSKKPVRARLESEQMADGNTSNSIASNATVPEAEKAGSVSIPMLSELTIRPAQWPVALAFAGRDVVAQPDTTAHKSVPKQAVMRGLSVRLAVAPDLSSIGLKNFTRPGTNVGILLEYRLASRWSVQAGVIQSTKVYKARTADYGYVPDYLTNQHAQLERIDGRCNMLDIPINVRYDVLLRPRLNGLIPSRWFVSGGVTTYIIKQEDYSYKYLNDANIYPNTPLGWSTSSGGYGFSQLNLSAGYERAISKRLSWQVEPFLKAPLRSVGYFKINLLSTGAFFSIRYKL